MRDIEDDRRVADRVRAIWARPGMDDPAQVEDGLRARGVRPFVYGQELSDDDPVDVVLRLNLPKWAIMGGCDPMSVADGTAIPTVDQLNRGRLVSLIFDAEMGA